jgi:cell division protein FtsB
MEENGKWNAVRKALISKYAIAIYVFAVIMIFVGDHSLIQFVKRAQKLRQIERQIDANNAAIQQAQRAMMRLDDLDSLERFAREEYNMHTDNEDVYLVD